jgi:ribosome-associated toxin RatA of RatAB toxin-antitoxin module
MHAMMGSASSTVEIDVPVESFVRVVRDYASYPQFVPELRKVQVGPQAGGEAVEVTYWLDAKLKVFEFTLRHEMRPDGLRIDWRLVRGGEFMRHNVGHWEFEPTQRGTRAVYIIDIDFGPHVPATFEKQLVARGLPNMLANFKARAESLQRR